jgi:DNA polymerase sigma
LEVRKLQKSAIRACTDLLVTTGGFKFRRSAFRGEEPKVTLLTPTDVTASPFPIDFSVNCVTPLYNAALLTECGQFDIRAKELLLFVKRWAKDRAICHAPKGHLPPYAWSLMAIYFLQVADGERQLLPPLEGFEVSSGLMAPLLHAAEMCSTTSEKKPWQSNNTTAMLFADFVHFYNTQVDWRKECVSVRSGIRAAPSLSLHIHVMLRDDGRTVVAPCIEDPFDATRNLSASMTPLTHDRLVEELKRADELCQNGASLTELLEPWKPPEGEDSATKTTSSEDDKADK